jgi:iron complex outermembrane receptor protein
MVINLRAQSGIVTGKVVSESKPVSLATISIPSLNKGSISNAAGDFEILNVPYGTYLLRISCVGYTTYTKTIHVMSATSKLEPVEIKNETKMLNDIVVSGVSRATQVREDPLPVEIVSAKQLTQTSAGNIIDAISKNAPGFETVKTGPNVSKPFINGLGYNRVLTLYDGMRVETQQWGDEHGVPMDDYLIEKAEVIKGPASILYGSDAIAGVLSLFPTVPKDSDLQLHGRFLSEYQSNNGLIGNSLILSEGGTHWSWQMSCSERIAKNYTDPIDGRVYNTNFKTANAAAFLGYHTAKGYSHLNLTSYDNRQGIPDGSRDSLSRKFTYQVYETPGENVLQPNVDDIKNRPVVPGNLLNSYKLSPLSQRIQDYRIYMNNSWKLGTGDINALAGFEQNIRREFDHPTDPDQAGEYILLNTFDYSLRYNAPSFFHIEPSFGMNGMYQRNTNKDATDFPIPDYRLNDAGANVYAQWKQGRWTIAGGVRYDHRGESGSAMYIRPDESGFYRQVSPTDTIGAQKQFSALNLNFEGITGSIGTTYRINDNISLKANIAKGYRSPNITELASNGLDPGAHIVYIGNPETKPEFSLQEDVGVIGYFRDISFNISAFNNYIQHYIYEEQKVDESGNPVVIVPGNKTFQYQQSNAQLYGMNGTLGIHPESWKGFHFDNSFSVVYGLNRNPKYKNAGVNGEYLPFIPPPEILSSISYDFPIEGIKFQSFAVKGESDYNMAQNRYLGLYNSETATPAYTLLNMSVSTSFYYSKKNIIELVAAVNNILNAAYQSHLSRLQYFEYYTASPNGHLGIYNMGRNISLKVIAEF